MRVILLAHRYLAVAVGLLMTLWCLSGFVMMYQAYPALTQAERLAGLEPLDLAACCDTGGLDAHDAAPAPGFAIEMLGGDPVLRLGPGARPAGARLKGASTWNLRTGRPVRELSVDEIHAVARRYGRGHGIEGEPRRLGTVDVDQWTVQSAQRNRPVHHFAFDDAAATEIYVSGRSGEVFQDTNRRERVLTWLGAIPHWLYPLELRRNGALWIQIVIWTSVIGTFLAATGLFVGIARLGRARARGRWSPYRGWWYWHHMSGLVFGLLALTWVFSGLMTVNPWGALSGGGTDYGRQLRSNATWGEVERFLNALETLGALGALGPPPAAAGGSLAGSAAAADTRRGDDAAGFAAGAALMQLESAPFDGRLHVIARRGDGSRVRLDASAQPAPLDRSQVAGALAKLSAPVRELEVMTHEDSFYYGHKGKVDLPVYRAILDDGQLTRLYINETTGSVRTVDATRRASRWIRTGLHNLDFAWLRIRPIWDLVVLPLLAGVTLVCVTGTWMALRRIRHDWRRARRRPLRAMRALE